MKLEDGHSLKSDCARELGVMLDKTEQVIHQRRDRMRQPLNCRTGPGARSGRSYSIYRTWLMGHCDDVPREVGVVSPWFARGVRPHVTDTP
jgi:hypothetical protein